MISPDTKWRIKNWFHNYWMPLASLLVMSLFGAGFVGFALIPSTSMGMLIFLSAIIPGIAALPMAPLLASTFFIGMAAGGVLCILVRLGHECIEATNKALEPGDGMNGINDASHQIEKLPKDLKNEAKKTLNEAKKIIKGGDDEQQEPCCPIS